MSITATIAAALVGGAAAAAKDIASAELKKAYEATRAFLMAKVRFELDASADREQVEKEVNKVPVGDFAELEVLTKELLDRLEDLSDSEQRAIGLVVKDHKAELLKLGDLNAEGEATAAIIEGGEHKAVETGDITAKKTNNVR